MINTWGELVAAIKNWFEKPISFERTPKLPEPSEHKDIIKHISSERWTQLQQTGLKRFSEEYFRSLLQKKQSGAILSRDEEVKLMCYLDHKRWYND
jgi:hypothetical protein